MAPSEHIARVVSRLDGVVALDLEVLGAEDVYPGLRELRLGGDLGGFAPWAGQDLMVSVPSEAASGRLRRYTVRRVDAGAGTVTLWVTTTTDGPGASWASGAAPGDRLEAVGPRGKVALHLDAPVHLFVVDASGLAAKCVMAEAVTAPAQVLCLSLLEPNTETLPTGAIEPTYAEGVASQTHVLDPADPDWVRTVLDMTTASLDRATIAAYVFGERTLVRDVAATLSSLGLDEARIAVKAYWRDDRANEANGEPSRDDGSE